MNRTVATKLLLGSIFTSILPQAGAWRLQFCVGIVLGNVGSFFEGFGNFFEGFGRFFGGFGTSLNIL